MASSTRSNSYLWLFIFGLVAVVVMSLLMIKLLSKEFIEGNKEKTATP